MMQAKRPSKKKSPNKAISVLGIAGMSLAASGENSFANIAPEHNGSSHLFALGDEEIADVSLATFHVFDNEVFAKTDSALVQVAWRGCGCGHGCGHGCGGCHRGCGGWHRGCGGWGGCGGCGWGWRPWCASRGGCHFC